jgi:hypothetical protein
MSAKPKNARLFRLTGRESDGSYYGIYYRRFADAVADAYARANGGALEASVYEWAPTNGWQRHLYLTDASVSPLSATRAAGFGAAVGVRA